MKKRLIGARASSILFNYLLAIKDNINKPFLLPANVCPIVPVTFLKAKMPFVFSDISIDNMLIDKETVINKVLNNEISGLLFVRAYGYLSDERDFFRKLKEINNNLLIVDDRCLCVPDINGQNIYSEADLTLFSTGYAKYVEMDYGGFAFINYGIAYENQPLLYNPKDHENLVSSMNYAIKNNVKFEYEYDQWLACNVDFKENEYFDIIANSTERHLKHKEKLNDIYNEMLPDEIKIDRLTKNWRYSILVDNKETILNKVFGSGLFASSHYASISHLFGKTRSPNSEYVHSRIINLFNNFRFNEEKAHLVSKIIIESL